jgi:hypothetical protein
MEIRMPSGRRRKSKSGKRQKESAGAQAAEGAAPAVGGAAQSAADDVCGREAEWIERMASNPATFADVELEVHERMRQHADRIVAALLAKASQRPEMPAHVERTMAAAEVPLRPVEKKDGR